MGAINMIENKNLISAITITGRVILDEPGQPGRWWRTKFTTPEGH